MALKGKPRGTGPRAMSRLPRDDPRWRPIATEQNCSPSATAIPISRLSS